MAERKVTASSVILKLDLAGGTSYDTVVCLENFAFTLGTNIIDAATMCGPDKSAGNTDFGLTFDGQQMFDPASGKVSAPDLFPVAVAKTTVGWQITTAIPTTGDEIITGTGFISGLDRSYGFDKNASFSGSIGIYGTPEQTFAP